jgi:hypothetical protein
MVVIFRTTDLTLHPDVFGHAVVCALENFDLPNIQVVDLVVPPARFQRATFRLGGGRSMQLSYGSRKAKAEIRY